MVTTGGRGTSRDGSAGGLAEVRGGIGLSQGEDSDHSSSPPVSSSAVTVRPTGFDFYTHSAFRPLAALVD